MFNSIIDHTLLKSFSTKEDIRKLCDEAIKYKFKSVCVNPIYVSYAKKLLKNTDILVCTVIGFPLGSSTTLTKTIETMEAIRLGADEIDMVINISSCKNKEWDIVVKDIMNVVKAAKDKKVKVIIETCYLDRDEKIKACMCVKLGGADFVKTSTGFGSGGATVEDIRLIKETVPDLEIKASGGISTKEDVTDMINEGATRIGTSKGVSIVSEE